MVRPARGSGGGGVTYRPFRRWSTSRCPNGAYSRAGEGGEGGGEGGGLLRAYDLPQHRRGRFSFGFAGVERGSCACLRSTLPPSPLVMVRAIRRRSMRLVQHARGALGRRGRAWRFRRQSDDLAARRLVQPAPLAQPRGRVRLCAWRRSDANRRRRRDGVARRRLCTFPKDTGNGHHRSTNLPRWPFTWRWARAIRTTSPPAPIST